MGGAFGQIVGTIDSWLGRSFLLARFFPWLLFALANLGVAALEFPGVRVWALAAFRAESLTERALDAALLLSAVAVVAYTLSPATQAVTRLLEGEGLPRWIVEPLLLFQSRERERLFERGEVFFQRRTALRAAMSVEGRLGRARAGGVALAAITDVAAIDAASAAVERLQARRYLHRHIDAGDLGRTVELVAVALARNCAELVMLQPPASAEDYEQAARLHRLSKLLLDVIAPYAKHVAEGQEGRALDARQNLYGIAELAPTRLGNDVAALRSYCSTRYGFDFDFLWPRLQLALRDQKLADALRTSQIQVDFSILCLTLSTLFVVGWFVVLALWGQSLATLLVVAGVGPPLIGVWLWMVHESYAAYAEVARSTVDLARFDLLSALRRDLPATLDEERVTWDAVARRLLLNEEGYDAPLKRPAA